MTKVVSSLLSDTIASQKICYLQRYSCLKQNLSNHLYLTGCNRKYCTEFNPYDTDEELTDKQDFRVYTIYGLKQTKQQKRQQRTLKTIPAPRYSKMPTNQDWTSVWPTAATFNWSTVPFPLRMGHVRGIDENDGIIPDKYANAELMKIPNFLHLTPAHVTKHCAELKQFCTEWPRALKSDEDCDRHFPVEVILSDYVFASPSIRDPRARTVTLKIKLSDLHLDEHARDKFTKLVGERLDPESDILTLTSDRCPTKKQNYDYIHYLLTALYYESWKTEEWESGMTADDSFKYVWDLSPSKTNVLTTVLSAQETDSTSSSESTDSECGSSHGNNVTLSPSSQEKLETYKAAVATIVEDENIESLEQYKKAVLKLLGIQSEKSVVS